MAQIFLGPIGQKSMSQISDIINSRFSILTCSSLRQMLVYVIKVIQNISKIKLDYLKCLRHLTILVKMLLENFELKQKRVEFKDWWISALTSNYKHFDKNQIQEYFY